METSNPSDPSRWLWGTLFGIITLTLSIGGYVYYQYETDRIRQEEYHEISAIADLKTGQILRWREEQLADARRLARSDLMRRKVEEWLLDPGNSIIKQDLQDRLTLELKEEEYSDVLLIDTEGNVLLSAKPQADPLSVYAKRIIEKALANHSALLGDLYRSLHGGVYLEAGAPILNRDGQPIAVLLLKSNAESLLYPLIQSWPTPSLTAETLLVRREGEHLLFLNNLRHRPNSALSLREPLTLEDLPAVQAVLAKRGMFRGRDYRGVDVLADLRPIPQSPWFLVTKVDTSEILAEARHRGAMIAIFAAVFILLAVGVTAYGYRSRQVRLYRSLYRSERERRLAQEEFRTTLYSIGDAVITTDTEGRVKQMNPVAERLTGRPETEAIGKPLDEVFRIVNEESRNVVENPVQRVLREGTVVGLANHTLLIAKDGSERPIADSGAPIRSEDGTTVGVVLVFRDQTQERALERERRESERRYRRLFEDAPLMYVITRNEQGVPFISDCNEFFLSSVGYSREEVLGQPLADFYSPDSRAELLERGGYARALAGEFFIGERHLLTRDGRLIPTLSYAATEVDPSGNATGVRGIFADITKVKLLEAELRSAEELYRGVFENAAIAIHLMDTKGQFVQVNRSLAQMLGYSEDELMNLTIFDLTHPDDLEASRIRYQKMVQGHTESYRVEKRYIGKGGQVIWADVSLSAVRTINGAHVATIGVVADITDRKHAEQERLVNERRLQSLVRISQYESQGVHDLLDYALHEALALTGSTVGWFGSYEEETEALAILSWSKGMMKNCEISTPSKIFPFENAGIWAEGIRKRVAFMLNDCQQPNPSKKGYPKGHIELTRFLTVPLFSGGRIVAVAAVANKENDYNDIDVRQLTLLMDSVWRTARARESEEAQRRLSIAIEQAAEGVVITRTDGTIQYVNPGLERMTGYSRDELIGQTPRILKSGEHDATFYRQLWSTITAGGVWSGRFINRRKDGRLYYEDATISPVKDASGKIVSFVAVTRDITEHLELSKQLLQAQKMEAIGTLAGGVAHDFNNILQVALGYSELLVGDEDLPRRHRADLQKIHESAARGADLVQRLLTFSRKTETNPQPLNLNRRINEMRKILERTIPKMIDIQLFLADDLATVNADPTQMDQVLMNLAVNARDAMPGGGKLVIETTNIFLDEEYARTCLDARPGSHVLLMVSDTGVGMDKDTMEHIFEPFYTTKESGKGTGLGLSMVLGIVQQHGGHIRCYSEPAYGTVFKIYLPALVTEQELEQTTVRGMPRGGSETILLVDDEDMIRDLGYRILTKAGYRVITASNGKDALEMYQQRADEISLVILDLIMPKMGGKECLEGILTINPLVKAIIASGFSADSSTKEALTSRARGFVNKPYDIRQVLEIVREILDSG